MAFKRYRPGVYTLLNRENTTSVIPEIWIDDELNEMLYDSMMTIVVKMNMRIDQDLSANANVYVRRVGNTKEDVIGNVSLNTN